MRLRHAIAALTILIIAGQARRLFADSDDDDEKALPAASQPAGRYFFNLLDHRSSYGKDFFADPFLGPEFDAENQAELDYLHSEKRGFRGDEVDAEFQANPVGQLSLAGEVGWDSEHGSSEEEDGGSGVESVDLAAYHPVLQFVSGDGALDYTAVVRLDAGLPTRSPVSGNDLQLTPYLGHLLRLGDHVSVQGWTGAQFTIAPGRTGQFIYGTTIGYAIFHHELPLPLTEDLTPILELDGQRPFSGGGQDALFGVAGFQAAFKPLGDFQPRLSIGYQFPIDRGAGGQLDWGIVTELFVDF